MDRKTLFDMECELMNECEDYIQRGSESTMPAVKKQAPAWFFVRSTGFLHPENRKSPAGTSRKWRP